jgi:hypothetical protein
MARIAKGGAVITTVLIVGIVSLESITGGFRKVFDNCKLERRFLEAQAFDCCVLDIEWNIVWLWVFGYHRRSHGLYIVVAGSHQLSLSARNR